MSDISMDNIFEKIIAGEIPCFLLYEDDRTIAFLDIQPIVPAHVLVIPKKKSLTVADLPDEDAAAIGIALKKVSSALIKATGIENWNILQNNGPIAGQVVKHVHFHLLPASSSEQKFNFDWPAGTLDKKYAKELQARIIAKL